MRKSLLMLLVVFSAVVVGLGLIIVLRGTLLQTPAALTTPLPAGQVARITVEDLNEQLRGARPPQVWDLRSAEAYAYQHIPGSQRVESGQVTALAQGIDRKQPIVTLCA